MIFLIFIFLPGVSSDAGDVLYGKNGIWVKGSTDVVGDVSVGGDIIIGRDSLIQGSIRALGDVLLQRNTIVEGDVEAGGTVSQELGVDVQGTVTEGSVSIPEYDIPTTTFTPGFSSVTVPISGTVTLDEGNYRSITVGRNGNLILTGGTYQARTLRLNQNATVTIQAPVTLILGQYFLFLGGSKVEFSDTDAPSSDFEVYAFSTTDSIFTYTDILDFLPTFQAHIAAGIATHSRFYRNSIFKGVVHVPYGLLELESGVQITGKLEANEMIIAAGATICGKTSYLDVDGDLYGDDTNISEECEIPSGYVLQSGDCNDGDATIKPGAEEICGDDIDQDCDGADLVCEVDDDGDGVSVEDGDCDDSDATSYPGATESCDSVDNDCNASVDESIERCIDGVVVPQDPAEVAPELSETGTTSVGEATEFLYSGEGASQTDVEADAIDIETAAVIRGQVNLRDGSGLAAVKISAFGHDEFGFTYTRENGSFDFVLNGGGTFTIVYQKDGYITVQRQVQAEWQDYRWAHDVVMIPLDGDVAVIDLATATDVQVAQGAVVSDDDGERQATVLIPTGTTAQMELPDGTMQTLDTANIRATEFTSGDEGPAAMPGTMPGNVAYTYALELTADEAVEAGAENVTFSEPLYFYVDNFLEFPTGEAVPMGYYDRDQAVWVPANDGRVIEILSETDGKADVDIAGSGVAADATELSELGFTDAELEKLANLYEPGQTLWRVPITHFSTWDCNWAFGGPEDGIGPPNQNSMAVATTSHNNNVNHSCELSGSIIDCENRALGESLSVAGTPYELHYKSNRMPGFSAGRSITFPLTDVDTLPDTLKRIDLTIEIAGQKFEDSDTTPTVGDTYTFTWNGADAYGRAVQGTQTAYVRIDYVYDAVYYAGGNSSSSFGNFGDSTTILGSSARQEIAISKEYEFSMGSWDSGSFGLAGWSFDNLHVYDPKSKTVYFGDGTQMDAESIPPIITSFAGTGATGYSGDGGEATAAQISAQGIATDSQGNIYIGGSYYVRKIDRDGVITTVAGTGYGDSGDGGLATAAQFKSIEEIAIDQNDNIYVADYTAHRVRRIDAQTGIVTTIAGTGTAGYNGEEGLGTSIQLNYPTGIASDGAGNIYIVDHSNCLIRKVDPAGMISTVGGVYGYCNDTGDGYSVSRAHLYSPWKIKFDANKNLYVTTYVTTLRMRKIGVDGIITEILDDNPASYENLATNSKGETFVIDDRSTHIVYKLNEDNSLTPYAGGGSSIDDYVSALSSQILNAEALGVDAEGGLLIAHNSGRELEKVTSLFPSFSTSGSLIASEDGSEVYHFDQNGKHLETLNAFTGAVIYAFGYDATSGILTSITDESGNITTIEHDVDNLPTAIVSPDSLRTELAVDAEGYLSRITNPNSEFYQMVYSTGGLLENFTDPNGYTSIFTYDDEGFLQRDENDVGGYKTLSKNTLDDGFEVDVTSAGGLSFTRKYQTTTDGTITRTGVGTNGLTTTTVMNPDSTQTTNFPDGTVTSLTEAPDPRLGAQVQYPQTSTIILPSGLSFVSTMTRETTVSAEDGSLTDQTDTMTVNSKVYTSEYTYDSGTSTRLFTTTTPEGRDFVSEIDDVGRVLESQVADLDPLTFDYDTRGRLENIYHGSTDIRTTTFAYHPTTGFIQYITNAMSQVTEFETDNVGRVTAQILPDARRIGFGYDASGNLTSVTPPGRSAHSFGFNEINLNDSYVAPDLGLASETTTYTYDLDQNLTDILRPDGQTIHLTYDTAGRLDTTTIARGSYAYAYSATTGQLETITVPDGGTLSYTYDGLLLLTTTWVGDVSGTITRTYDSDFRIDDVSVSGGSLIDLDYDNDGLLTVAGDLTLSRDTEDGSVDTATLGNFVTDYNYNTFGELNDFSSVFNVVTTMYGASFVRDDLGRITEKTESILGTTTEYGYTYDSAGRLTDVTLNDILWQHYDYDDNSNRTGLTVEAGTTSATYDDQDRLNTYGSVSYTYNDNGDLTQKENGTDITQYSYDELGNLLSVTLPSGTSIEYIIDGNNRRIGKKVDGTLTQGFLYLDQLSPIAELDATGNVTKQFIYGERANTPTEMQTLSGGVVTATYQIISDHLGSPVLVINSDTGDITQEIAYDPFGQIISDTNPGFQPFGFAGGLYDSQTGLVRFGARDYDASVGRWTTKDPILFNGGDTNLYGYVDSVGKPLLLSTNFYLYTENDPINFIDPNGLFPVKLIYWDQFFGGINSFTENYNDMKAANTIGADLYFHCKANCEASQKGQGGEDAAVLISEGRELFDQYVKGDSREQCDDDRSANKYGRSKGSGSAGIICGQICSPYRPVGLPTGY